MKYTFPVWVKELESGRFEIGNKIKEKARDGIMITGRVVEVKQKKLTALVTIEIDGSEYESTGEKEITGEKESPTS